MTKPAHDPPAANDGLAAELETLRELQAALIDKALAGEGPAADRVLAIMDRRAKLMGYYSPRPESDAPDPEEVKRRLLEKLHAMAERQKGEKKK